jgi:hypothetical protein
MLSNRSRAGLRAGVLAGLASGILLGALLYLLSASYVDVIRAEIVTALPTNSPFTVDQLIAFTIDSSFVFSVVGGTIGGAILGLIFGWAESRFWKSRSPVAKGLLFGMVLWVVDLFENVSTLVYSLRFFALAVTAGFAANLLFGYLLGRFYGRPRTGMSQGIR